ncbi:peptidoglycan editing factor PgeF [Aurantimonas sp. Leaf443]|uniref:peptidoglycan editing factor PgeF n=1 Tax=Aurantimonas sp. Leaf443 TaxID=1736378 RepID=UPI0006FB947E|nr:peptidoglycan editing factor PgeF [Aurantimonas sp. Leaf443]KQT82572.1 polyphenol oxidase [Aurantimonas sp. Leaf443]
MVLRAAQLDRPAVSHGFFTRCGGVSAGLYESLNAGIGSHDEPEAVAENRRRMGAELGFPGQDIVSPWQTHSATAVTVDAPFPAERPRADGIVTATPGLAIGVVTADCGPVLFCDAANGVVGAAHAGWRGALGGVLEATIEAMEAAGAARSSIVAVLGPTITQANYEVGTAMMDEVLADDASRVRFFAPGEGADKRQFDLPGFIVSRLAAAGTTAHFIGRCTYGEPGAFFSYRRATHRGEADYGRQLSAIAIRS